MSVSYEKYENGKWIQCTKNSSYDSEMTRILYKYDFYLEHIYYMKTQRHRLDGPAYERLLNGIIYHEWWVYGKHLVDFKFRSKNKEILFLYIQHHPDSFQEIELLAKHNSWLNEEELLLLNTAAVFK